jgi:hypothetical protein
VLRCWIGSVTCSPTHITVPESLVIWIKITQPRKRMTRKLDHRGRTSTVASFLRSADSPMIGCTAHMGLSNEPGFTRMVSGKHAERRIRQLELFDRDSWCGFLYSRPHGRLGTTSAASERIDLPAAYETPLVHSSNTKHSRGMHVQVVPAWARRLPLWASSIHLDNIGRVIIDDLVLHGSMQVKSAYARVATGQCTR